MKKVKELMRKFTFDNLIIIVGVIVIIIFLIKFLYDPIFEGIPSEKEQGCIYIGQECFYKCMNVTKGKVE